MGHQYEPTTADANPPGRLTFAQQRELAASSLASNPAEVDASIARLWWYDNLNRNWTVLAIVLAALAAAAAALAYACLTSEAGGWRTFLGVACAVVAGLFGLLALAAGLLVLRMVQVMKSGFRRGALLPGVVVSVDPLHYLSMTDLSTGADDVERWVVKRIQMPSLPGATPAVGMRLACVATYTPGEKEAEWADFAPYPIHWATGDEAMIADRLAAVGEAEFLRLEKVIRSGKVPTEPLQLMRYGSAKAKAARRG